MLSKKFYFMCTYVYVRLVQAKAKPWYKDHTITHCTSSLYANGINTGNETLSITRKAWVLLGIDINNTMLDIIC